MKTVRIPEEQARVILSLYQRCMDARKMFEPCQGVSFRGYILHTVDSPRMTEAFNMLEAVLASGAEEEKPKAAAKESTEESSKEPLKENRPAAGKTARKRKEEGNVSDTERDEKPAQDTAC